MKLLDIEDVAALLGKNPKTIRRWMKAGKFVLPLPGHHKYIWTQTSIDEWRKLTGK